jgi:hypothetical protein
LKSSTSNRLYRKDKRDIQLVHTKSSQPLVGRSSQSRSLGPTTRSISQDPGPTPPLPLVVEPIVEGALLPQTLIDGGSELNIIFTETLKKIVFHFKRLIACNEPFFGIVPSKAAYLMGRVSLSVTFGTEENFRTKYLSLEVADLKSLYHALLGRPMLARFMDIPHYTYLVLKISAPNGVLTIYGDLIDSFKCDNEALDIAMTNACINASVVMVAEAAKVAATDLTITEKKCIETALDATPATKKVCLSLADPWKTVVICDNLRDK